MSLPTSSHPHCLMTGATGMVGSYVMAELLQAGHPLAVLARGKGKQSATDRIDTILRRFESAWNRKLNRPQVFYADLTLNGLGLSGTECDWIATNCDQILHSAASLRFAPAVEDPDNEPYRTNVDGTHALIDFCSSAGIDRIHHVSTAYVCGMRSDRILESDHDTAHAFANDYERSKAIAESLVEQAFDRDCRTLYRPSIVVDPNGLAPVSGDRTIYGAFSMYQMLAARFGLPQPGHWMRNLGFQGNEHKNLIDAHWIAQVIARGITTPEMHGRNYHLTAQQGTAIETLDEAFRIATEAWLAGRRAQPNVKTAADVKTPNVSVQQAEIDKLAAPFVKTFLPYFRDDPIFDRTNMDHAIALTGLPATPTIDLKALLKMIENWSVPGPMQSSAPKVQGKTASKKSTPSAPDPLPPAESAAPMVAKETETDQRAIKDANRDGDEVVICGYAVRLPGNVDDVDDFARLLFEGKSAIDVMPESRLDRSLYFDSRRGIPGKTYTCLGGCVDPQPLDVDIEAKIHALGRFDLTHRQFAQVASAAFRTATGNGLTDFDPQRGGVFVGHSGGTQSGGPLAMGTMAETATSLLGRTEVAKRLSPPVRRQLVQLTADAIRKDRPQRQEDGGPELNAYSAASLTAQLTGLRGRREVIDAACSSSLIALQHASFAIAEDRLDLAIVGGATFNNVDNLALFSQSGACSDSGCHPFDSRASGLISSEGYVAIVVARRSVAEANGMPIHAVLGGVGIASDGKGKGLWAPRSEGQQLAMRRAWQSRDENDPSPLRVDYQECHATSTQVGDATELESLTALLSGQPHRSNRLPIGSVKSNLGHLLEAAGLVGVVKCLLAMRQNQIPPSIGFEQPTDQHDWRDAPVEVVDQIRPWPIDAKRSHKVAGVNAFGIGGLNAHAIIEEATEIRQRDRRKSNIQHTSSNRRYAIVGRGLIVPGASTTRQYQLLLGGSQTCIGQPPADRWVSHCEYSSDDHPIGVGTVIPHCLGAFVEGFQFDAQSYRIPPKLVRNANPAQLMLIEAVRQAIDEFDAHQWTIDRQKIGVSVGTIFGGQFSNELQVGLRLPEISKHLERIATGLGIPSDQILHMVNQYREVVLDQYPALLDETGGFTASTLASAIARVFNLMGGAYAVDADEASSGLAVLSAMERLDCGDVDLMICGATHRANDLVALEQLYRKGQLVESGQIEDLPNDGSQIFPGEGVATILLQRFEDAVAQGRTIHGVIDGVTETFAHDVRAARRKAHSISTECAPYSSLDVVAKIGHLGGAHGLVRTIAATLGNGRHDHLPTEIHDIACDGYQINYRVSHPTISPPSASPANIIQPKVNPTSFEGQNTPRPSARPVDTKDTQTHQSIATLNAIPNTTARQQAPSLAAVDPSGPLSSESPRGATQARVAHSKDQVTAIRLQTDSAEAMRIGLENLLVHPSTEPAGLSVQHFNAHQDTFQAAIAATAPAEIQAAARALLDGPLSSQTSAALPRHAAWLRSPSAITGVAKRTAWLFPGQGSQYPAAPSLVAHSETARDFLSDFDTCLASFDIDPVGHRIHDPKQELGRNIWWTQLWVLAAGATHANELLTRGFRPDVVLGHSFGECTAAWCAGVMSTEQAIRFAKQRSEAVLLAAPSDGELLSVRGAPDAVKAALQGSPLEYTVTHHNAPQQTVIAGTKATIGQAKQLLSQAGLASVVIAVPAAFHTPEMQSAQDLLSVRFGSEIARPPRFGFLSAVSNRYLAEPKEIMNNLIEQLTRPVCFSSAVSRLVDDGCGLMIEVGPNDVLTRLSSSTVGGRAICLSFDDPARNRQVQETLIVTAVEAFSNQAPAAPTPVQSIPRIPQSTPASGGTTNIAASSSTATPKNPSSQANPSDQTEPHPATKFAVVDVTRHGRANPSTQPLVVRKPVSAMRLETIPPTGPVDPTPVTAPNETSTNNASTPQIELAKSFLFDLVVDLTGYDPEIIEFDADLEGELGVDSIKKAQLIGELVQWADLEIDLQSLRLAQFNSLTDILALIGHDNSISNEGSPIPTVGTSNAVAPQSSEQVTSVDLGSPEVVTVDSESLKRMIIALVVDQTGYDEDIIDMDADLEGELGVDSIKRAQLIGELETHYNLQSLRETNLRLSDFPTLASIHAYVLNHLQSSAGNDPPSQLFDENEKKNGRPLAVEHPTPLAQPITTLPAVPGQGTRRFVLETVNAPRHAGMPTQPTFHGPAIILGDNPVAEEITQRLLSMGVSATKIGADVGRDTIDQTLDAIWKSGVTPHLFLTTTHDPDATWQTSQSSAWITRKEAAFTVPYRVCQRWMQRMIDDEMMHQASLVTFVRGGGQFGFRATAADTDQMAPLTLDNWSAESGGMAGLTKAMLIEAWMRGYRDTPMLVIDSPADATAAEMVDGALYELAVPSYDEEVVVRGHQRQRVRGRYQPLENVSLDTKSQTHFPTKYPLTRGGVWVVAGGGRGITAMTAMELAQRHDLKLHLLGMAPAEPIDSRTRQMAQSDRPTLRRQTMARVQAEGGNPVKHWRNYEKSIEIDQTLLECKRRGIEATYHSADVSDHEDVIRVMQQIRATDGPIRGIIQGAGSGQDARFDRKRPEKVAQCLSAKIDGCAALAAATQQDPLEWFIGFGSISGRFGANGHTDYSAANDMLAKMIGRLSAERPETRCFTYHWHAWGDIGMATKPEAKLALDMIGMEFMPAREGLQHFLNEIENGGDENEVLITDRRYLRKFFPNDGESSHWTKAAMLDPAARGFSAGPTMKTPSDLSVFKVTLDPVNDAFLSQHLVHGRPTLPFAIAIEMLAESARVHGAGGLPTPMKSLCLERATASRPLKCLSEDAFAVETVLDELIGQWMLVSDLRRKDGRMVESRREHFSAHITFQPGIQVDVDINQWNLENHFSTEWFASARAIKPTYLGEDAAVYHGPSLQCLREIQFAETASGLPLAMGTIVAPSPAHLGGEHRPLDGWCISPATFDAVLYAAGMLAYHVGGRPSLPIQFEKISTGRLPEPGEPLQLRLSWQGTVEPSRDDLGGGWVSALLLGQNQDFILQLDGYRIGWLS